MLRRHRVELEREWARWVPEPRGLVASAPVSVPPVAIVRTEVVQSWARSAVTVDPTRTGAPVTDGGDIRPRWSESPLRQPVTELADELRSIAEDAGFVVAVTDESGTILWTCGGRVMRRRAERVNFAPGGRWAEPDMGTNALSLALRLGRPSEVFSAEHLVAALHDWACYCAPIRDGAGRTLGVLDLSTTWDRSHPLAMSTVRTLVSTIETRLHSVALPDAPTVVSANPAAIPRLTCLGSGTAAGVVARHGVRLPLRPRQVEILALLALEPAGFTAERLREAVYGDRPVTATTLKAEVSHLRRVLGGGLANRRYALTTPIACDAVDVLAALRRGDTESAVRAYTGELLPTSEAPAIAAWRDQLQVAVRAAVLASPEAEHALIYGERAGYDIEVHEHALSLLPTGDGRRAIAAGRLAAALHD